MAAHASSADFVTVLALGGNYMGAEGVCALAESLKVNRTLHSLDIRGTPNPICATGAIALAEALKVNTTLQWLGLPNTANGEEWHQTALPVAIQNHKALRRVFNDSTLHVRDDSGRWKVLPLAARPGNEEARTASWARAYDRQSLLAVTA